MKFEEIIKNLNTEGTINNEDSTQRQFFNGKLEGEIIIAYPKFKIYESNNTYSLRCFGRYYTTDKVDTNYSISVILTSKSMDTKDITKITRDNMQVIYLLLTTICPHVISENREYNSYLALLKDANEELNKNIAGKDIKLNIRTNEFGGKYYYFLNKGLSITPIERKTIQNEKSFPDIDILDSKQKPTSSSKININISNTVDSNNPYKDIMIKPDTKNMESGLKEKPKDNTLDISTNSDDDLPW